MSARTLFLIVCALVIALGLVLDIWMAATMGMSGP